MKLVGCIAWLLDALYSSSAIHLIGDGYDDEHRHNTVIYSVCYWYATTGMQLEQLVCRNTQSMTIIN